jgi:hypothetical protein
MDGLADHKFNFIKNAMNKGVSTGVRDMLSICVLFFFFFRTRRVYDRSGSRETFIIYI